MRDIPQIQTILPHLFGRKGRASADPQDVPVMGAPEGYYYYEPQGLDANRPVSDDDMETLLYLLESGIAANMGKENPTVGVGKESSQVKQK